MATNIPPHNLAEIVDATVLLIDERKPESRSTSSSRVLPGPDFPTGGLHLRHGRASVEAYAHGPRPRPDARPRASIERASKQADREAIVITEIPFQVNKAALLERIAELVREKRIEGIRDLRDESDREGMRVVIELKRDDDATIVLNQLYQLTPLQSTFGVNMLAIVDGPAADPHAQGQCSRTSSSTAARSSTRRTRFDLKQAEAARARHGLGMAVAPRSTSSSTTIRASKDPDEAHSERLRELSARRRRSRVRATRGPPGGRGGRGQRATASYSSARRKAILDMRLARLTGLEREKLADRVRRGVLDLIAHLKDDPRQRGALFAIITRRASRR